MKKMLMKVNIVFHNKYEKINLELLGKDDDDEEEEVHIHWVPALYMTYEQNTL
jgi:hypothetical protein